MIKSPFYVRLVYTAGAVGLMSALSAHPLSAQGVGDIVRGLNNVINPSDAQRLEDQARRNNQPAEQRYWRDYRTGLASSALDPDTRGPPDQCARREPTSPFHSKRGSPLPPGRGAKLHAG